MDMGYIDDMIIFERDLFIDMIEEEVQAEKNRAKMAARSFS